MTFYKNKNYIKVFSLLFVMLISVYSVKSTYASEVDNGEVTFNISATQQGEPAASSSIAYENIQTAYENIMKGNIPNELEKSVIWNTSLSNKENFINLGAGLRLGQGITHSSEEAKKIIQILFQSNFDIFQFLNGTSHKTMSDIKSLITDENGKGSAQAERGLLAVISNAMIISFVDLASNNQNISVDLDGTSSGISLEFTGIPENSQSASGAYILENNQKIGYKIRISKDLLKESEQVFSIQTPPNVVIDSSSVPLQKKSLLPSVIPEAYYQGLTVTSDNYELLQQQVFSMTSEKLKSTYTNENYYTLPRSDEDITITGTLSVSPNVTEEVNFLFNTLPLTAQLNLHNFNMQDGSNVKQPSSFQITVQVGEGVGAASIISAPLSSAGINFVMIDGEKNKLISGAQYVLGKKEADKYYISSDKGWKEVEQSNLSHLDLNNYILMSGGNIYNLDDNQAIPMVVNSQNWDRDFQAIQSRNQSLLGIRGLGQGKQYFVMQVKAPEGYSKVDQPHYFTVHNNKDNLQSPRNSDSIGFATEQAMKLNGQIPGYMAGANEFNVLSVTSDTGNLGVNIKIIIIPIMLIILFIIFIGVLLVWKF